MIWRRATSVSYVADLKSGRYTVLKVGKKWSASRDGHSCLGTFPALAQAKWSCEYDDDRQSGLKPIQPEELSAGEWKVRKRDKDWWEIVVGEDEKFMLDAFCSSRASQADFVVMARAKRLFETCLAVADSLENMQYEPSPSLGSLIEELRSACDIRLPKGANE